MSNKHKVTEELYLTSNSICEVTPMKQFETIPNNPNEHNSNENNPHDPVNHPNHYCTGKYECFDVMLEVFGKQAVCDYCKINAFKYLYRTDKKNGVEDIKKAIWYLNKYVELKEKP